MILTKGTLKELLNYASDNIDETKTEPALHKEIKCLALEYDLYGDISKLDDIIVKFINLCHLKV